MLNVRGRTLFVALGIFVLGAAYCAYSAMFGVNVLVWDEWIFIPVLERLHFGILTFHDLWLDQNTHRRLFPYLIQIAIGSLFHLNSKVEMYLGDALLVASYCIVYASLPRRLRIPSVFPLVLALNFFSLAQNENATLSLLFAWDLILASACATAVILLGEWPTKVKLPAAVIVAIVGSFSSFQGLLIWPSAAVMIWAVRRTRPLFWIWCGIGAIVIGTYLYGLQAQSSGNVLPLSYGLSHPWYTISALLVIVGSVAGSLTVLPHDEIPAGLPWMIFLGVIGAINLALTLVALRRMKESDDGKTRGLAVFFLVFSAIWVVSIAVGRPSVHLFDVTDSRYVTYTLLLPAGWLLAFAASDRSNAYFRRATYALVGLQYIVALVTGVIVGIQERHDRFVAREILPQISTVDDATISQYAGFEPRVVRAYASFAWRERLANFSEPAYAMAPPAFGVAVPTLPQAVLNRIQADGTALGCWQDALLTYRSSATYQAVYPPALPNSGTAFVRDYDRVPDAPARCRGVLSSIIDQTEIPDALNLITGPARDLTFEDGFVWNPELPRDLLIWGDGQPLQAYGSLNDVAAPGRWYRLSAVVDARYTSGQWPCFYLANTDGSAIGMTCTPPGKVTTASTLVTLPDTITKFRFVAYTNGTTVQDKKMLAYINPSVIEEAGPNGR